MSRSRKAKTDPVDIDSFQDRKGAREPKNNLAMKNERLCMLQQPYFRAYR